MHMHIITMMYGHLIMHHCKLALLISVNVCCDELEVDNVTRGCCNIRHLHSNKLKC